MAPHDDKRLVLTASLTSDVAQVARGLANSARLIEQVLNLEHDSWETILYVGHVEYHQTKDGPFPNQQMRVSVRPSAGVAALNYVDHDDAAMSDACSYNPEPPDIYLVFNGETGAVFPRSAVISMSDARDALHEWLRTRQRPTCIEWRTRT